MRVSTWAIFGLLLAAAPLRAQRVPSVEVNLGRDGTASDGPTVSVHHVLDDPQLEELMKNGFSVAMHFRLELWRTGGVFNELERSTSWDVYVQYDPDPYQKVYHILRRVGNRQEDFATVPTLDSVQALLARPYHVTLPPSRAHTRYYYDVVLDVESLRASDLSELQRWLRGDLQPAVRGKTNPLSAIGNAIGRLLSRVLGGAKRTYEATSPTFVTPRR